ncbi:MAG: histidine kinase [Firmicutes bacterium]|nr:histidine kinase [Bacillota bacterium]
MKNTLTYTRCIVVNIQQRISKQFQEIRDISQSIIYNEEIYNILCENNPHEMYLENYECQKQVNGILKNLVFSQDAIQSIAVYNNNSYPYFWDADNNFSKAENIPLDIIKFHGSSSPQWIAKDGTVYFVRAMRNKETLEKIGTMVILLKTTLLDDVLKDDSNIEKIMLISDNGVNLSSQNSKNCKYVFRYNDVMDKISEKTGYYIDRKYLVNFTTLDGVDWSLLIVTPLNKMYRSINIALTIVFFVGIFVFLFNFAANQLLVKSIVNPINQLNGYMVEFEKLGKTEFAKTDRKDEIGYLLNRFNEMTHEITKLINTLYVEKIQRKNAQIKVLQSQINPHFIYNTLETINWMAQLNGINEVSDMITDLASLMEANAGKNHSIVTIEEELGYVKKYCNIMKYRYHDTVEFRFNIEEDCKKIRIPCMILQPLVENAISHGIGKSDRNGIVLVQIARVDNLPDGNILIQVVDNGSGIDEETIAELNEKMQEEFEIEKEEGTSIGLVNTSRRIRLFYGEKYGISISSKEGCYCCVKCYISDKL